jgi:hypothetical protein
VAKWIHTNTPELEALTSFGFRQVCYDGYYRLKSHFAFKFSLRARRAALRRFLEFWPPLAVRYRLPRCVRIKRLPISFVRDLFLSRFFRFTHRVAFRPVPQRVQRTQHLGPQEFCRCHGQNPAVVLELYSTLQGFLGSPSKCSGINLTRWPKLTGHRRREYLS